MKWWKNPNLWFILCTIIASLGLCIWLIMVLTIADRTEVNIITVVGTVLTISALVFTIKEQYRLKRISTAISNNTRDIQDKLIHKSFEWNIEKCAKYVNEIQAVLQNELNGNNLTRIFIRLIDLKEGFIECKKVINIHKYYLSSTCLERLKMKADQEITPQNIVSLIEGIGQECKTERILVLDEYIKQITGYITQIQAVKFEKEGIGSQEGFLSKMGEIHTFINESRSNQFLDL